MKVALITDQHFGAREGSTIILEHQKKFYENTFFPFLDATGIKNVICLGDIFDKRKYTNNFVIDQCKKFFFDELQKRLIDLHIIVGNHDCFYKNTLFPNTPDLLLGEYENVAVVNYPRVVSIHDCEIAMIPWICQENYDFAYEVIKNSRSDICMGHFEIEGFQMYRGVESHGGLSQSTFDRYDKVFSGHYHHRSTKGNITYLGTPYELTWQDYGDPKGFHVFDLETRDLTFIENPQRLFVKIEYNDLDQEPVDLSNVNLHNTYVKLIVVNKTDYYKFDFFLNKLYTKGAYEVKIIEDISDFSNGEIADDIQLEDTQSVLSHFIESIETDIDKSKLKHYIQSLFTEAVNSEA